MIPALGMGFILSLTLLFAAASPASATGDGDRWLIDATDPNIEGVVGEIRLNEAIEGGDMALAGTLRIPGSAAFAVTCIGP